MRRRPLFLTAVLALVAGSFTSLAADYKATYKAGIRQGLDRDDWNVLATQMRDAIAEEPQESKKKIKIYGARFSPYLPHYYLGLALYNLGNTEGALREWEISEGQGAIVALAKNDRKLLESRLGELRSQVAEQTVPPGQQPPPAVVVTTELADPAAYAAAETSADEAVAAAEAMVTEVGHLAADPLLHPIWESEAGLGAKSTQARERLQRAKKAVEDGKSDQDIAVLTAAKVDAEGARTELVAVRDSARDRKRALVAEREAQVQATNQATQVAAARADAARDVDRAERKLAQVAELSSDQDLATIWSDDESLGGRERKATELTERARFLLEEGSQSQDLQTFEQSRNLASEALLELAALTRTAPDRRQEIQLARQEEENRRRLEAEAAMATSDRVAAIRKDLQDLDRKAQTLLAEVESGGAGDSLEQQVEALREQMQAVSRLSSDARVDRLDQARNRFDTALRAMQQGLSEQAAAGPPADLLAAAEAYFRADYDRAAELLDQATFSDPKASLQAHLFRAAARYALFVVAGERDSALMEGSAADIRALREIDPTFEPHATAFSPRFGRFFAETVAAL